VNSSYSWADYAIEQGYPVLAIDRLGNGESDHPNSITVVQYPAQLSQIHSVLQMARSGQIPGVPTRFEEIIYVGHSYGSILGNALNRVYPDDADATILTGFSNFFITVIPGVFAQAAPLPADIEQPSRFGDLDPGYLEFTVQDYFYNLFYYPGEYDPNFASYDWSNRGTISAGEAATILLTGNTATGYTCPVLVATGEYDAVVCNDLGVNLAPIMSPNCFNIPLGNILNLQNYLEGVAQYYPDADFEWYAVPKAGHDWQFHYSGYDAFGVMHEWMASKGF
jgi:pimeloyl-ACP methyl ester carboxylesterase